MMFKKPSFVLAAALAASGMLSAAPATQATVVIETGCMTVYAGCLPTR